MIFHYPNLFYCPKCGKELKQNGNLKYECWTPDCSYTLPNNMTIDISYKSQGIAKALSNLCNYPFNFKGLECTSMESFIQSLKAVDPLLQKELCTKQGVFCYNIRTMLPDWRITQTVYMQGEPIDRHSQNYITLLTEAYQALYQSSTIYRHALNSSKPYILAHTIGCTNSQETLLTPEEFISIINALR